MKLVAEGGIEPHTSGVWDRSGYRACTPRRDRKVTWYSQPLASTTPCRHAAVAAPGVEPGSPGNKYPTKPAFIGAMHSYPNRAGLIEVGAPVWARSRIPQPPRLQLSALSCLDYRSEKVAVGRIRTCNDVRIFGPFFLSADRTIGPPCARYPRPLQCCQRASCPGGLSLPPL